ncbi:hypothetical protein B9Z55_010759 [Caenorhabditis nigoni]|uniref:Sdz-33 F-box domain-containing protein n=1 Tax=Caenorhabditis nigoni TaxID=1611254 RepID=A0A2G5UH72_9PELO|nr:hypothetical protein B9Z55_010759 [Caenorhabditis nigoni]
MKALRIPIPSVQIKFMGWAEIIFATKNLTAINFILKSQRSDGMMTSLDDIPVNLDVSRGHFSSPTNRAFTLPNQGMSLGKWIQHLCSIFQSEDYRAEFTIGMPQLDIKSLRNIFPKLRSLHLTSRYGGQNERDILYTQNILKAFLPDVEVVRLFSVPLHENLSIAHIAATNLRVLCLIGYRNSKIDDILALNVEWFRITTQQITLQDLNRFFKLWKKGFKSKLKHFSVFTKRENNTDWNILLKGLQADEAEAEELRAGELEVKNVTIRNSARVRARIQLRGTERYVSVHFDVSN